TNLLEALRSQAGEDPATSGLLALAPEKMGAFFGIGFGHQVLETLCEAMEHENLLAGADFWQDVQSAVAALADSDPEAWRRALQFPLDEAVLPTYRAAVTSWPSPDGKQVDTFTRMPYAAENAQTYFHWAHYLHKTISQDHSATLALLHGAAPTAPWYDDLL